MSKAPKEETCILAFDLSAKASAFAAGTYTGDLIQFSKYVAANKGGRGQKLHNFAKWVSKSINRLPYTPSEVVIEAPYYRRNIKTYGVLNMYVAITQREVFRLLGLECSMIAPSTVKSVLNVEKGATHAERKLNMITFINSFMNLQLKYHKTNKKISDDDIADAIAVYMAHLRVREK